jgi:signal transduction histidine kinase
MLEISVSDTGIGISKKDQTKLFEPFGYLEKSKSMNTKGIGLGLHISQQIAKEFGGEIIVDSEKDQGSTFCFVIDLDFNNASNNK